MTISVLASFCAAFAGACSNSGSGTGPDVQTARDTPAAETAVDKPPPAEAGMDAGMDVPPVDTDVPVDATDASVDDVVDASDGGPMDVPPLNLNGYIRFLNMSRGVGTVRFIARSAPGYVPSYIEAVVREGTSSGYIETLPVSYLVNSYPAPDASPGSFTDGGMFPTDVMLVDGAIPPSDAPAADAPAVDAGMTITEQIQSDVYFRAGCTVILAGSPTGTREQQTNRRLWRIADIPMRVPGSETGLVRVISAYVEGPPLDVDETGGTRMARILNYFEPTGFRVVPGGMRTFEVRNNEDSMVLGRNLTGTVTNGYPHTLYLWGNGRAANRAVEAILTNDFALGVTSP